MTEESLICEEEEQENANQALQELLDVLRKRNLRTQDLVVVYGNLGYALGASIEGVDQSTGGPSMQELQEQYYTEPTLGVSLMLQGYLVTSWYSQVNDMIVDLPKENKDD